MSGTRSTNRQAMAVANRRLGSRTPTGSSGGRFQKGGPTRVEVRAGGGTPGWASTHRPRPICDRFGGRKGGVSVAHRVAAARPILLEAGARVRAH